MEQAIVFGGGARSALWRAIIGDVLNLPMLWTPTVESAGLGAAMLAGVGSGVCSSLLSADVYVTETAARDIAADRDKGY